MNDHRHAEDVGAYVLGALPEPERADFETHLEACADCRREVDALRAVTGALALSVPHESAPAALRQRVMTVVREEAELLRAAGPEADRLRRRPGPAHLVSRALGGVRFSPRSAVALAGALAAAVALGFGIGQLAGGGSGMRTVQAEVEPPAAPTAHAALQVGGDVVVLRTRGMPPPGPGRVYQVWLQGGPSAPPVATRTMFSTSGGDARDVMLPKRAGRAWRVMVTSEPAGGSPTGKPSRPPVIVAKL